MTLAATPSCPWRWRRIHAHARRGLTTPAVSSGTLPVTTMSRSRVMPSEGRERGTAALPMTIASCWRPPAQLRFVPRHQMQPLPRILAALLGRTM